MNFNIWYKHDCRTLTSNSLWQKETIYQFINLVDWLFCNLLIRNSLRKSHVIKLVASPINLIFKGYPSVSSTSYHARKLENWHQLILPIRNLIIRLWVALRNCSLFICRYLEFPTSGCQNVSTEILAKFQEKTPNRSGVIRYFCSGKLSSFP